MKLKRSDPAYRMTFGVSSLIKVYNRVEFSGAENIPRDGPVLVVPKHQSYRDVPLEAHLLTYAGRKGNWIMKAGLSKGLERIGGIPVGRGGDVRKIKDKAKRRLAVAKAEKQNIDAAKYVKWLYSQGEVVVPHLEGTRSPFEVGPLKTTFLDLTRRVQDELGIPIPVVPVGIEYRSIIPWFEGYWATWLPYSRIAVRAGKPLDVNMPDIADVVKQEWRRLSGVE